MKPIATVSLLSLLVTIGACAPYKPWRTEMRLCEPSQTKCSAAALQRHANTSRAPSDYFLGFVELNDQGDLWQPQQMQAVLDYLSTEATNNDLLMIVFVHGWHHSAQEGDGNIETFRTMLADLAVAETFQAGAGPVKRKARKVAGVYVGWRGDSLTLGPLNNLTFWERKNTAAKVGHGEVTTLLSRLELIKRTKDSIAREEAIQAKLQGRANSTQPLGESRCKQFITSGLDVTSQTKLVVVGHSFGGLVVHSAIGQILEERAVLTKGADYGCQLDIDGFGNLVVLINPAFEAQGYSALHNISSQHGWFPPQQLPVELILTSKADAATGVFFPLGRRFSTIFERNGWDQKNLTAVGHYQPYITHELYQETPDYNNTKQQINSLANENKSGPKLFIAGLTLERTKLANRNPFLNISVTEDLIKGHNDIGQPKIIEFIKQMILIAAQPEQDRDYLKIKPENSR